MKGKVKFFNTEKGFGFLFTDSGELFFHISQCEEKYQEPLEGDLVSFKIGEGQKGPRAENVSYIKGNPDKYFSLISRICDDFIKMIVKEPSSLEKIEWREFEKIIRQVFEGLGFESNLTPGSKDGGKDIIIEFIENGIDYKYYIELKHWKKKSKVGEKYLDHFLQILIRDETSGGLFLSSSGFTRKVLQKTIHFENAKLKLGNKNKIVSLCRRYIKLNNSFEYEEPFSYLEIIEEDTIK